MRIAASIAALILVASPAVAKPHKAPAAVKTPLLVEESPYPCPVVRWALRTFDRATLEQMARDHGIALTPGQIKAALACEKG